MPVLVPGLADRCIIVNGVAKTYAMTGWRVGWLIGPPDVVKAAANLQSHSTSNVCNVAQRAALAAVSGGLEDVREMRAVYDRRRRTIVAALADLPGVLCPEPEGAFYAFPSFAGVLGRPFGGSGRVPATTLDLADLVLEEAKVAFVPGEAFGAPGLRAVFLRPGRRRPGRRHGPNGQAVRLARPGRPLTGRLRPAGPGDRRGHAPGAPAWARISPSSQSPSPPITDRR